jgi:hypothetical protein
LLSTLAFPSEAVTRSADALVERRNLLKRPVAFVEPPRVEWHRGRPFAFGRLPEDYARELEALAHELAPKLDALEPRAEMLPWAGPYGSRFAGYNIFLLEGAFLPLFRATQALYLSLVEAMALTRGSCCLRGWLNIQQAGERIGRHTHEAKFIGTFAARAEGSETRFGLFKDVLKDDVVIPNRDGQLLLTFGLHHFHETSPWHRSDVARVTYAMDVVSEESWRPVPPQIPFDFPPLPVSGAQTASADS